MAEITYLDFDLLLERSGPGYRARVLHCPVVPAACDFSLPFSDLELENFILKIGHTRRTVRGLESSNVELAKDLAGDYSRPRSATRCEAACGRVWMSPANRA